MDEIHIDNLKIFAHHGVFDFENQNGQNFYVNAVLYIDAAKAAKADDLNLSVDYGAVCAHIERVMTENTYNLLETTAHTVALEILRNFSAVKKVDVEIRKPEAPVDMEFESISLKVTRAWHYAVLSLGSNMGESEALIRAAADELASCENIKDSVISTLIKTKPYGYTEQDDFINGVLTCKTLFSADELLDFMHDLENKANRKREIKWGPRTLDLDLIFYDDEIIATENLTVPHCDMHNREFVLKPLCEIAPWYMHPVFHKRADCLLRELEEKSKL